MAIGLLAGQPPAQSPNPPRKTAANATYFSGAVTQIRQDSITVVRTSPAKDPVTRTFVIDSNTKIEGKMRENARVTVRYAVQPDGAFRALHIIVR